MIANMLSNKKLNPKVIELFFRGTVLNISLIFITQSYFDVPKKCQTQFYSLFYYENSNKRELQQIGFIYPSDINSKDLINLREKIYSETTSFFNH